MCDCPIAGVMTSHESYRSWIIFKGRRSETGESSEIVLNQKCCALNDFDVTDIRNSYRH